VAHSSKGDALSSPIGTPFSRGPTPESKLPSNRRPCPTSMLQERATFSSYPFHQHGWKLGEIESSLAASQATSFQSSTQRRQSLGPRQAGWRRPMSDSGLGRRRRQTLAPEMVRPARGQAQAGAPSALSRNPWNDVSEIRPVTETEDPSDGGTP